MVKQKRYFQVPYNSQRTVFHFKTIVCLLPLERYVLAYCKGYLRIADKEKLTVLFNPTLAAGILILVLNTPSETAMSNV